MKIVDHIEQGKIMKTPHKHAELIKAWADGAEIEKFDGKTWREVKIPIWYPNDEYRIKPEPKPDVVLYAATWFSETDDLHVISDRLTSTMTSDDNIKLTFDGETKKLIKAEVLE